jgi:PAS domain S-box-containing protein
LSNSIRVEVALRRQPDFLRQIIDINPHFIFVKDREFRFTLVNEALAEAYGTTVEDLIGRTDADFNDNPEEVEWFRRDDLEVMDTLREKFIPEEVITDAQGRVRYLQTIKRPLLDANGVCKWVLGVATDRDRARLQQSVGRHPCECRHPSSWPR